MLEGIYKSRTIVYTYFMNELSPPSRDSIIAAQKLTQQLAKGDHPNFDTIVELFGPLFPLLYKLKNTPQDPGWHAEGNVHIHTQMVLDEMYSIVENEASHLSNQLKLVLIFGAIFHDIAKPVVTKPMLRDGVIRIGARGHEYIGGSYLVFRLLDLGLEEEITRMVIDLVNYHQWPTMMVKRYEQAQDPIILMGECHRLHRRATPQLLYYLELADMRGRTSADRSRQIQNIETFRELCEKTNTWNDLSLYRTWAQKVQEHYPTLNHEEQDYIFSHLIRQFERGNIKTMKEGMERLQKQPLFEDNRFGHLYIMCGPSGCGKSSWIKKNLPNATIISLDDLRQELTGNRANQESNQIVVEEAYKRLKKALINKETVVWDATSLLKEYRTPLIALAHDYRALSTIVLVQKKYSDLIIKNQERKNKIPNRALKEQFDSFQWPEVDEAYQHIITGPSPKNTHSSGTLKEYLE